jgi:FG-GAP repeat protein/IPT/TIG domain-containing protein
MKLAILPFLLILSPLASSQEWDTYFELEGQVAGDWFGSAIAQGPDLDGDGLPEILVGAGNANGIIGADAGLVYAYAGSDGSLVHIWEGQEIYDHFGSGVILAGDVDADGFMDIAVSAVGHLGYRTYGKVHIYSGLTRSEIFVIQGSGDHEYLGAGLASLGDIDGDGHADIAVGTYADAPMGAPGYVSVISGATEQELWRVTGSAIGTRFGKRIAPIADLNGDGIVDLIVAEELNDVGATDTGTVYLLSGADGNLIDQVSGTDSGVEFGQSVSSAGDVNGDGIADVIVSAGYSDPNGMTDAGSVFVFSGADLGIQFFRFDGMASSDFMGWYVAGGEDFNADGIPDIVCGAPGTTHESSAALGATYLFSGSDGQLLETFTGTDPGGFFGGTVGIMDDLTQDGISELAICARFVDPGGLTNAGRITVFAPPEIRGSNPNKIITSVQYDSGRPVLSANVEIYDSTGTQIVAWGEVRYDGLCTLELTPGNYLVRASVDYENHGSNFTSYNWFGSTSKEIVQLTGSHTAEIQIQFPNPTITLPGLQATGFQESELTWEVGANYWRAGWDHPQEGAQKMIAGYRSHIVMELWEDAADPLTPGYDGFGSHLPENGQYLGDFLEFVIQKNPSFTDVPFHFVGHSMGGLYSRSYISKVAGKNMPGGGTYPTIRRMISVGSPNLGTNFATNLSRSPYRLILSPAIKDLTTKKMEAFNLITPPDPNMPWSLIVGTRGKNPAEGKPNDGWVGDWSVRAPEGDYPSANINYEEFDYSHSALHDEYLVLYWIIQLLEAPLSEFDMLGAFAPPPPPEPEPMQTDLALATNGQPAATSIPIQVDDSPFATFHFQWSQGDVATEVLDPSGVSLPLTSSYSDAGMRSESYLINAPAPGIYSMNIQGLTGLPSAGEVVGAWVVFDEGPVLSLWSDPELITGGASTQLLAEPLDSGAPIPGYTVSAIITDAYGNQTGAILLYDDGLHGDGAANDGRYGEMYTPAATGRHMIKGIARGQRLSGVLFERHGTGYVDVAAGSVSLTGNFFDEGIDSNGDGAFEELRVTAELDITIPSTYQVVGVLGQAGVEITRQTTRVEVLSSGLLNVDFSFNGTEIYRSGMDGQYSLMELSVFDETAGLVLEYFAIDAYLTSTYLHTDFGSPAGPSLISLSPNFGSIGGGEELLLAGSAFDEPGLEVWFGDRQADFVEVITEGQIRVRVPAPGPTGVGAGGLPKKIGGVNKTRHTVDVRVVTLFGEDELLRAYTYIR